MKTFFAIFALTLFTASHAGASEVDAKWLKCKEDADCDVVRASGCGCSGGGGMMAINTKYVSAHNRALGEPGACMAVMSNHWTCKGNPEPKCVKKKCELVNPKDEDEEEDNDGGPRPR